RRVAATRAARGACLRAEVCRRNLSLILGLCQSRETENGAESHHRECAIATGTAVRPADLRHSGFRLLLREQLASAQSAEARRRTRRGCHRVGPRTRHWIYG